MSGISKEAVFRKCVDEVFKILDRSLSTVDPDMVECELGLGSLTLIINKNLKCILSSQPSIGQLWLAIASEGRAYHFIFDEKTFKWIDIKDGTTTLLVLLTEYIKEKTGLELVLG